MHFGIVIAVQCIFNDWIPACAGMTKTILLSTSDAR
jgi:hypothetical protein